MQCSNPSLSLLWLFVVQIQIIQLDRDDDGQGDFVKVSEFDHPYPATKVSDRRGKHVLQTLLAHVVSWDTALTPHVSHPFITIITHDIPHYFLQSSQSLLIIPLLLATTTTGHCCCCCCCRCRWCGLLQTGRARSFSPPRETTCASGVPTRMGNSNWNHFWTTIDTLVSAAVIVTQRMAWDRICAVDLHADCFKSN